MWTADYVKINTQGLSFETTCLKQLEKAKEEKKKMKLYLIWKVRFHPVPNTATWAIVEKKK